MRWFRNHGDEVSTKPWELQLSVIAVVICLMVAAAYGLVRGDWVVGGLAGLTVAISLLPQEFPMVLAVFLAIGSSLVVYPAAGLPIAAKKHANSQPITPPPRMAMRLGCLVRSRASLLPMTRSPSNDQPGGFHA